MELNFEIHNGINQVTGVTEKIILTGLSMGFGYKSKMFITVHYVYETSSNGVILTTKNGGYRLDEGAISVDKTGTILPALDELTKEPLLDEEGNIIPRVDACFKFISTLHAGFFPTVKAGILEFENIVE